MPEKKKKRQYRFNVLTQREIDALDNGALREIEIAAKPAYTQFRIVRQAQQSKDLKLQEFAESWLGGWERNGPTAADVRHLRNFNKLVDAALELHDKA